MMTMKRTEILVPLRGLWAVVIVAAVEVDEEELGGENYVRGMVIVGFCCCDGGEP